MAVRREKSDQRQQAAQDQGDPTLDVEQKNLPTPSNRRSAHNTPVLLNGEGAPSQSPAHPAGTKTWTAGLHPLHPTIRPLTGNNLRRRPIGRANANALAAKGGVGGGLVAQPVGEAQWPEPEHFQEGAHEQHSEYLKPAQS